MSVMPLNIELSLITNIPLAMTLCAICSSADLVIPCLSCARAQCEECFSREDDLVHSCKGCRMESELEMDFEYDEYDEYEEYEDDEEDYPPSPPTHSTPPLQPLQPLLLQPLPLPLQQTHPTQPLEYLERGIPPFDGILYPSEQEWKYANDILVSHILFTTRSSGMGLPSDGVKYLVGRMIHRFANHSTLTTEYMMSYEPTPENPFQRVWVKYMSTYYSKSPCPYDENIFYPYPLPLQFLSE